jgi:hypothetical protein
VRTTSYAVRNRCQRVSAASVCTGGWIKCHEGFLGINISLGPKMGPCNGLSVTSTTKVSPNKNLFSLGGAFAE